MKISLKKLKEAVERVVKEAMLAESEVYVDDEGMAHDDEGNSWHVGTQYAGGTYRAGELPSGDQTAPHDLRRHGGSKSYPRRSKSYRRY
jgi:hypothetical protein